MVWVDFNENLFFIDVMVDEDFFNFVFVFVDYMDIRLFEVIGMDNLWIVLYIFLMYVFLFKLNLIFKFDFFFME